MLDKNMEKLNFYNFAKTQTCHMNDGIFGEIKYREYQFVYQLKVIGNLNESKLSIFASENIILQR